MRANSIIILVIAIVMGGIAAFLARNWLISRTQATATTTTIIAAAKQLPFGTILTDDSVVEMPWAAKVLPEGSFSSKEALFKDGRRIALAMIQQNEPILTSKVTGPGQRASLSTLLDKDKRAITIRVDDVRGVAGFLFPNDRVDVVLIRNATESSGQRQSDMLLQDIKVIAVDQIAAQQKDNPVVVKAVTLEVTPFEAQKISLATSIGSLSLILRKAGDSNQVSDRRVVESDLNSEAPVRPMPQPMPQVQVPPAPLPSYSGATVNIIRNLKKEEYKVEREAPHSADRGTTTAR
jgi:pilus assembly protein CpaB